MIPLQEEKKERHSWFTIKMVVMICVVVIGAGALFYYYRAIAHRGSGGISDAVHSLSSCKIEISSFPAVAEDDRAAWIGRRLGANQKIDVVERSSEQISIGDTPAIRWNGTMNGNPAVFIYAFTSDHAYEITPSTTNEGNNGASDMASCEDALGMLIGSAQFSPELQGAFDDRAGDDVVVEASLPVPAKATSTASMGSVLGAHIAISSSTAVSSGSAVVANDDDEEECL